MLINVGRSGAASAEATYVTCGLVNLVTASDLVDMHAQYFDQLSHDTSTFTSGDQASLWYKFDALIVIHTLIFFSQLLLPYFCHSFIDSLLWTKATNLLYHLKK